MRWKIYGFSFSAADVQRAKIFRFLLAENDGRRFNLCLVDFQCWIIDGGNFLLAKEIDWKLSLHDFNEKVMEIVMIFELFY